MPDRQLPDPTAPLPDAPLVVAAFLARCLADQEGGGLRPLAAYQALFPGHEALIAAEHARLLAGEPSLDQVVGERLCGYRILRELGRGAQGVVYLAEDERLGRRVALKVLPGAFGLAAARQRLLREAQAASRLDDPGICTVYEAGETSGIAYIAMRYVEGESLAARIERERAAGCDRRDPGRLRELLGTFARIGRALHTAHEKGLVHRDIKPSNLMLDAHGAPVVLDFGLAHFEDHPDGSLTGDAQLGTPAYMSPEQLAAQQGRVDHRTDVFSLAVTLYEAIALQHPFAAPTRERLFQRILSNEPQPLRSLVRGLPRDLDVVLACALDKDRSRRYATAAAFAEDLQRLLDHRPITARKARPWTLAARWAQRHPAAAVLVGTVLVGIGAFTTMAMVHNRTLAIALDTATRAHHEALHAQQRADGLRLASAAMEVLPKDAELAIQLARQAIYRHDHVQTRGALLAGLAAYRPRPAVEGVHGADWIRLDSAGTRLAIARGDEVLLVDAATRQRLGTIVCPEARLATPWWAADGSRLLLALDNEILRPVGDGFDTSRCAVRLYDGRNGALVAELPGHHGRLSEVDFDTKAGCVVTATRGRDPEGSFGKPVAGPGEVRTWSTTDGRLLWERLDVADGALQARFAGVQRANQSPDVDVLTGDGHYVRLRGQDGTTGSQRKVFDPARRPPPRGHLTGSGRILVVDGDEIVQWNGRTDEEPQRTAATVGHHLLVGNGIVRWTSQPPHSIEFGLGEHERTLAAPPLPIVHLAHGMREVAHGTLLFDFATTTIAIGAVQAVFRDGSLRNWRCDTGEFVDLPPSGGPVVAATSSAEGDVVATLGDDGTVRVFRTDGPSVLPAVRGVDATGWDALRPQGDAALVFVRNAPRLVDLTTGVTRWEIDHKERLYQLAAFRPDGDVVAVGADDGTVLLLRTADGSVVAEVPASEHAAKSLGFDPSGRWLAIARDDVTVVDAATGAVTATLTTTVPTSLLCFAGDGTRLVTGSPFGHRLFTFPGLQPADGRPQNSPQFGEGVPVASVGEVVLIGRELQVPGHRIGGPAAPNLVAASDGSSRALPPALAASRCRAGALAPDGRTLVLPRDDGMLLHVDLTSGAIRELPGHERAANCIRYAADGSCFASGHAAREFATEHDEPAVLVHAADGTELLRLEFPVGVRWFDLDAAGRWLAIKTGDGELRRYPVRPLEVLAHVPLRDLTGAERARFALPAADRR